MRKLLGGNIMVREIIKRLDEEFDKVQEDDKSHIGKLLLIGAIEGALDSLTIVGGVITLGLVVNSISKVIRKRGS
jgi:hypothetical protein